MSASNSISKKAKVIHDNYGGLIKQSYFKILINHFFDLFHYMDSVVPNFFPLHEVITVWRLLQFIGPSFCASFSSLWNPNKTQGRAISIISIFFHIIPVKYRRDASVAVEFTYCGINIIFFILIIVSAQYYKKTAKLPKYIPSAISIFINTFGYLVHPINLNLVGEDLGRLINGESLKLNIVIEVLSIILSLICFALWFWFFSQISVVSFLFRPNSLLSVLSSTQTFVFITTSIVTFIFAVASQLSKYPSAILTFIGSITYLVGLTSVYTPGSYISSVHKRLVFSSSITSCLFTFIMGIYVIIEKEATFAELFIFVVVLVILYILSNFVLKRSIKKQMQILDDYHCKSITIDEFEKPGLVVKYGITAMQFAHPACLNWQIFRDGSNKWPDNAKIWVTFGKFVSIYPKENMLFSHIIYAMEANKLKGNLAKHMIAQAKSIYAQREVNLSAAIKGKLNKTLKHVQETKRKVRHVWDLAIQGQIREMEPSINNSYQSMIKTRSNFNHLLSQYPNNRFVARGYLHFIQEVECDPIKTAEWSEKVKNLHRGYLINHDKTNLLGFHAFPNLPPSVSDSVSSNVLNESESMTNESEISTEATNSNNNNNEEKEIKEQISIIYDHIDHLKIPAVSCIKTWKVFLFLVLLLLPVIIILAIMPNYLDSLSQCLDFEYHLSYLRVIAIQTPVFANHYLSEKIGFLPKPMYNMKPAAYGYENETDKMLQFLLKEMANSLEQLGNYRNYKRNNEDVKLVHEVVFSGTIPYKYYVNQTYYENATSTLQDSLSDVLMSATHFIEEVNSMDCSENEEKCWDLQKSTYFLNPYQNFGMLTEKITSALHNMNVFLLDNSEQIDNLAMFICLFICIVYCLILLGIMIYQIHQLEKCKKEIYKCLTSLPKSIVSSVSESLKMMNKNNTDDDDSSKVEDFDSELNKQEENILKIFTSSSDASMKTKDKIVIVAATIFMLICALCCTVILALAFPEIANKLYDNSPHMGFILGSSGYGFSVLGAIDNLIHLTNCHGIAGSLEYNCQNPKDDPNSILIRNETRSYARETLSTFITYYHSGRFGGETNQLPPYSQYEKTIQDADSMTEGCENINFSIGPPEYYSCYPMNVQMNIFKPLLSEIFIPIVEAYVTKYNGSDQSYAQVWNMLTMGIYSKLYPMFENIIPEMLNNLNGIIPPRIGITVIFIILAFIDLIIIIIQINNSEKKMKFALSLLTQCPPKAVMQTQGIMNILSGDFESKTRDVSAHNSQFFDSIVQSIPDGVIVCNSNFKITSINKAAERIYGISSKEIIGKDANEFFSSNSQIHGNIDNLFEKLDTSIKIEFKKKDSDNKSFLEINNSKMGPNFVIVTCDETQATLYNTLISEERAKSDHLLSSILPPNLVKRVQDGEKNISFGVQSASILFLDMVMSTLNKLFGILDANLATHSTMTKIKCIGDCYMCSGGIFVEINQAAVHAKETVEFGLEAISSVEDIDKQLNLSLRIRVGVNTGGPIVAGVLGTDKPTFEILGPAINMAQQMENHGVPMKVHVSRSTYELIYGGNFEIKERGQIEIKKGSVLTYLVESKKK